MRLVLFNSTRRFPSDIVSTTYSCDKIAAGDTLVIDHNGEEIVFQDIRLEAD